MSKLGTEQYGKNYAKKLSFTEQSKTIFTASTRTLNLNTVGTSLAFPLWSLWRPLHSTKKIVVQNGQNNLTKWFVHISEVVFSDTNFEIFSCCTVFSEYSSAEWFWTEIRDFASIYSREWKSELCFLPLKGSEGNSESLLLFLFHRRNSKLFFRTWDSSEGNSESLLLFCSYFCSMGRNSELFSLPWKGLVRNLESFLFRRNSQNSFENNHLFCLPHLLWNYFLSEITNPNLSRSWS